MKHLNKFLTVTLVAGSLGLAGLGIAQARAVDPTAIPTPGDVDTAVTTTAATITTPSTATPRPEGPGERHQQMFTKKAAEFNMSVTDLQNELRAGKPMYQIAAEHGVTYSTERQQKLTDLKTRLDDMVKVKYMTQAEAHAAYQAAQANPIIDIGHGHGWMH